MNVGEKYCVVEPTYMVFKVDGEVFRVNENSVVEEVGSAQTVIQNAVLEASNRQIQNVRVCKGSYGMVNIQLADNIVLQVDYGATLIGYFGNVNATVLDLQNGLTKRFRKK